MSFQIGDVVEIISDEYKNELKLKGKENIGNVGVITYIDESWLGVPYKVVVGNNYEYWAWDTELKFEKKVAVEKKMSEIEALKRKLKYAENELKELLES